jgi:hypothetical protein
MGTFQIIRKFKHCIDGSSKEGQDVRVFQFDYEKEWKFCDS